MAPSSLVVFASSAAACLALLYVRINDQHLCAVPPAVKDASPNRWADEEIESEYARAQEHPIDVRPVLPPRTGRRYIVVGGAGFLGGWIVAHLLLRGEDPRRIRVLDIRAPTRRDLTTASATLVDFRICDISDERAVHAAFTTPWPSVDTGATDESGELTVFHTAATIRFYERAWSLVPLSAAVNVRGTQNILDAARAVGASVLVSTSSGSVALHRSHFWLWPWQRTPPSFVQRISDDDSLLPSRHNQFFSNYAYTKRLAEALVRDANGLLSANGRTLRTGCIRPGNGVFGPGGDILVGAALVRKTNPTWISSVVQNFVYVENASLAHLCYEERLLSSQYTETVGGQAYCVSDAGPPPSYGDVYRALSVLTNGRVTFPPLSPTLMLFFAQSIEVLYLARHFLTAYLPKFLQPLSWLIPRLPAELINLQPSLFSLVLVHLLFDDSRARTELGYAPQWTTLQGVCALVDAFERGGRVEEARQRSGGGIGLGLASITIRRPKPNKTVKPKEIGFDLDLQAVSGMRRTA